MFLPDPVFVPAPIAGPLQELDLNFARPPCRRQPGTVAAVIGAGVRVVVERFDYSAARLSFEDGAGALLDKVPEGLAVFETDFRGGHSGITRQVEPLIRRGSIFGLSSQADYDVVFEGETVLQMREQRSWRMYKSAAAR